jgi:hypothetical protein
MLRSVEVRWRHRYRRIGKLKMALYRNERKLNIAKHRCIKSTDNLIIGTKKLQRLKYIYGRKKEWKLVKKGIFSPCCIFSPQLGKWGN